MPLAVTQVGTASVPTYLLRVESFFAQEVARMLASGLPMCGEGKRFERPGMTGTRMQASGLRLLTVQR